MYQLLTYLTSFETIPVWMSGKRNFSKQRLVSHFWMNWAEDRQNRKSSGISWQHEFSTKQSSDSTLSGDNKRKTGNSRFSNPTLCSSAMRVFQLSTKTLTSKGMLCKTLVVPSSS